MPQIPSHCVGVTCRNQQPCHGNELVKKQLWFLQAQVLSLQLLQLPVLLEHLRLGTPPAPETAPLLASSQDVLCQTFSGWASNPDSNAPSLTPGHAPAMLGFAAIATLSRDIPNFSGQHLDVCERLAYKCQQCCFVLVTCPLLCSNCEQNDL